MSRDSKFHGFDHLPNRVDLFLHQMNRIINPIVKLSTIEEVEQFIVRMDDFWEPDYTTPFFSRHPDYLPNITEFYKNLQQKTRVIAITNHPKYHLSEERVKEAAEYLAGRDNLRVG